MTDLIVKERNDGTFGVYSAFNDALLSKRDTREKAVRVARERITHQVTDGSYRGETPEVRVVYGPLPKEEL